MDEPHAVAISPDGRHWYVSVAHGEPTLWKFEMEADRLVGRVTLPTAGAARIGITPDGNRAFVPDYDRSQPGVPSRVAVVDLADLSVVATPVVCDGPHHAEVDPGGELVAVACSLSDEIVLLDARTLEERGRFAAGPEAGPPGAAGPEAAQPGLVAGRSDDLGRTAPRRVRESVSRGRGDRRNGARRVCDRPRSPSHRTVGRSWSRTGATPHCRSWTRAH